MRYIKDAQDRAKRRKSPWNLLLIPASLIPVVALWVSSVLGAEALHMTIYPSQSLKGAEGVGTILTTVSPFFGAIPIGMIIGNFLVRLVPPARKILDVEASTVPNTDFWSSQKSLVKMALILAPVSILLTVYGARLPWS